MTDRSVQQMEVVLNADRLEACAGCRIQLGAFAAVAHIDLVDIVHELQRLLLADIFIQGAAEVVGDVVLAVREGACTAEAAHDAAALAADTGLDLVAVDGAAALFQRMTGLKDGYLQFGLVLHQLISREDTAGAGANDDNVVFHKDHSFHCFISIIEQIAHRTSKNPGDLQQHISIGSRCPFFPLRNGLPNHMQGQSQFLL